MNYTMLCIIKYALERQEEILEDRRGFIYETDRADESFFLIFQRRGSFMFPYSK